MRSYHHRTLRGSDGKRKTRLSSLAMSWPRRVLKKRTSTSKMRRSATADDGPSSKKAKARHVMKGFSEENSEYLEVTTPQVARDSVMLTLQLLCSRRWKPGYLDFTQAFHSGDPIDREIYAEQPVEGIPDYRHGNYYAWRSAAMGCWMDRSNGTRIWQGRWLRNLDTNAAKRPLCLLSVWSSTATQGHHISGLRMTYYTAEKQNIGRIWSSSTRGTSWASSQVAMEGLWVRKLPALTMEASSWTNRCTRRRRWTRFLSPERERDKSYRSAPRRRLPNYVAYWEAWRGWVRRLGQIWLEE